MTIKKPIKPKAKVAAPKRRPGRQTLFAPEIAALICARLAEGKSLTAICKAASMPAESTVRAWAVDDVQGFAADYARAREIGYARLGDEILRIADTPQIGTKSVSKITGLEVTEGDMIEHRRLQVDARKWMLSKMLPKVYGDKMQQDITITDNTPMADRMKAARERSKKS